MDESALVALRAQRSMVSNENELPYYVAYKTIQEWNSESDETHPMQAYAALADPDTMYYHEAMKEPDRKQFI
jgi:ornithine carbamoyltransferase